MQVESRSRSPYSDINVTPFVDIMLVLLVTFMVAAPLLEQGISVALPKAETGKKVHSSGVVITLTREHVLYVDKEIVPFKQLRERLSGMERGQAILIRADENAYVKKLVELCDTCRELGFQEIQIATTSD